MPLMQAFYFKHLADQQQIHGRVNLAINLDSFNPITCALSSWLRPEFVSEVHIPKICEQCFHGVINQTVFLGRSRLGRLNFIVVTVTYFQVIILRNCFVICHMSLTLRSY